MFGPFALVTESYRAAGPGPGAVDELAKASLDESSLAMVEKAYAAETDPGLKGQLERMSI